MILSVSWLYKSFISWFRGNKKTAILQGVNIRIAPWEIYAFLGLNGAGKTTTLECIMGIQTIDTGQITFFGNDILDNSIRKRIGYAPDKVAYFDHLTGWENLMIFASYLWVDEKTKKIVWQRLFNELELEYSRDRLVSDYSQGMKQRLWIIISLISDPELLIWDEPMNGLDPLGRIIVKNLIKSLQSQGKTILFSTHILSDVEDIADRFGILAGWQIIHESQTKAIDGDLEAFFCSILDNYSFKGLIDIK